MIKNIIFDIGNVLVDFRYREYMRDLGIPEEVMESVVAHMIFNPLWVEWDRGVIAFDTILEDMKKQYPQEAVYFDLFWKEPVEVCRPFPKTRSWLMDLKKRGYHIYLLSNYPEGLFTCHWEKSFDFTDIPDGKVISYEVKHVKPEPEIYHALLDKYQLKPAECVFMDDRMANVEAARKLSILSFLVQNQEQAIVDLEKYLND